MVSETVVGKFYFGWGNFHARGFIVPLVPDNESCMISFTIIFFQTR
jgi:hypothetical protein